MKHKSVALKLIVHSSVSPTSLKFCEPNWLSIINSFLALLDQSHSFIIDHQENDEDWECKDWGSWSIKEDGSVQITFSKFLSYSSSGIFSTQSDILLISSHATIFSPMKSSMLISAIILLFLFMKCYSNKVAVT